MTTIKVDAVLVDADTIVKNRVANARLFCALVFLVSLAAYVTGQGRYYAVLALLAAAPVGIAVLIDTMPDTELRRVLLTINGALPPAVALALLASFLIG